MDSHTGLAPWVLPGQSCDSVKLHLSHGVDHRPGLLRRQGGPGPSSKDLGGLQYNDIFSCWLQTKEAVGFDKTLSGLG